VLRSHNDETEDALLFFYQHLGQALNRQSIEVDRETTWARIQTILHFFTVEFRTQDCDTILGSGEHLNCFFAAAPHFGVN
jgi:hypothetical protein